MAKTELTDIFIADSRDEEILFSREHRNCLILVLVFVIIHGSGMRIPREYDTEKVRDEMERRLAMISIVVEDAAHIEKLNHILHEYSKYIIGRMGIPYPKRNMSLISIAMDAPGDKISAMTGKIGMLSGISSKALYAKLQEACKDETTH